MGKCTKYRSVGAHIQEIMSEVGVSLDYLADRLDWTVNDLIRVINGDKEIDQLDALDLSNELGMSPEFWINLQENGKKWGK